MSQDVQAVQDLIEDRKKQRKFDRKQKTLKLLILLFIHALIAFSIFLYIALDAYQFKGFDIKGNQILSQTEIEELIDVSDIALLNFAALDMSELESHPLIQSIKIDAHLMNQTIIDIREYRVVASLNDTMTLYLLENGTVYQGQKPVLDVPQLIDFSDDVLRDVAETLSSLKDSTIVQMSQIFRDPQSFDDNYTLIIMQDGIQVSSGFKGYSVLNQYESILKALNPEHKCLSIDELSLVPYSFPCTLSSE